MWLYLEYIYNKELNEILKNTFKMYPIPTP